MSPSSLSRRERLHRSSRRRDPVADPVITQGAPGCPTCGAVAGAQNGGTASSSYVYALGGIECAFPAPLGGKGGGASHRTGGDRGPARINRPSMRSYRRPENRYLARQMCWVLMIQGLETYILQPRDPTDLDLLIGAIEPHESPWISTVIGVRGPVAPPDYCNGLMIPIVAFDQIYSFSRDALIDAIPRPEEIPAERFGPAARELFDRIMQMTDNAGATDENRALNYLAVRYPSIYAKAAEAFAGNSSLSGVEVRPSPLSGTRNIVDCIFSYTNRNTDYTEKSFVRCDMTEEFPFLVTKLSPYYDR